MRFDWWTLALQTVNVLILIWLLGRFFFRPVAAIVARRQEETGKLLADAATARADAVKARIDAESARARIAEEREALVQQARDAARDEKAQLLAQASQQIVKLRSEGEAEIQKDRAAAQQAMIDRAADLAVDIARRLLGRLPPGIAMDAFLKELCQEVRALSAEARESLEASSAIGHPIEIVTATPLSAEDEKHVYAALKAALQKDLAMACRIDPSLVAGIELHGRNVVVRNSWREDLHRIRAELNGDRNAHNP